MENLSKFSTTIIETIENSNVNLNPMQKGRLQRGLMLIDEDNAFHSKLEDCLSSKKISIINHTVVDERFVIIETNDTYATFRTVDLSKGDTISQCSDDLETQFLITLGYKYDGLNSQFAQYACKMVGKELK